MSISADGVAAGAAAAGAAAAGAAAAGALAAGAAAPGAQTTDPLVRLTDVSFSYPNGTAAVDELTLDIMPGRILGLVGPSGCGKSTLLHLLAGLSDPTAGTIERTTSPAAGRHFLTMVFQKDTLLPWLRVTDNVKLYFRFHRHDRTEIAARSEQLLKMVGLEEYGDAYPHQLSGGMRRRVAFLAAITPYPRLLLLDEPFSSLDEPTRIAIHQDVYDSIRKLGMAAVIVTHDLAEAITLCDEVLISTSRPARVAVRHEVPFGRDRNMMQLRQDAQFLSLYGRLWEDLSIQISGGQPRPDPAEASGS